MSFTINGWSVTEALGIVACMIAMLAAVLARRPLARALINMSPFYSVPPVNPLRQDTPEETTRRREGLERLAVLSEIGIVAAAALVWVGGILALVDGREGPILDALL